MLLYYISSEPVLTSSGDQKLSTLICGLYYNYVLKAYFTPAYPLSSMCLLKVSNYFEQFTFVMVIRVKDNDSSLLDYPYHPQTE